VIGGRPLEIDDAEIIVRGVCSPYHYKRGKLTKNAYLPPPGTDETSTMRASWIGAHACRHHALLLENSAQNKNYVGLAVLSAKQIRHVVDDVIDSRKQFRGHADIKFGFSPPSEGEPQPPEEMKRTRDKANKLRQLASFYADPNSDPCTHAWTGEELKTKTLSS
jgi:hypothetical protein